MIRTLLIAFAMLANIASADPLATLRPEQSRIDFAYRQMGVTLEGRFTAFTGQIAFDPARLQSASGHIEIKLASIDTGLEEANAEVAGKDWFNTALYPLARFESTAVKPLGGNRYQVDGRLTIKGRTQGIGVPFTYSADANGGLFTGAFTLRRADFAIGEGAWRDFSVVANDITVRFKLRIAK